MTPPAPAFTDFDSMPDDPMDDEDEDDIGAEADEEDFS
jgi:hypothetical protein